MWTQWSVYRQYVFKHVHTDIDILQNVGESTKTFTHRPTHTYTWQAHLCRTMFTHTYPPIHAWTHTQARSLRNTPFRCTYTHMQTWVHTNIHNQIYPGNHLIGYAHLGILKPSYSYTYRHVYSKTNGYHTHITQPDIQQAYWLRETTPSLRLRIKHAHLLTQTDMQSHTHSLVQIWSYSDTYTLEHHHVTCSYTQTHTHS